MYNRVFDFLCSHFDCGLSFFGFTRINSLKKKLIVAIVGNSGSGKTTIVNELSSKYGYDTIVSFTTRPMRENETDGVEHWFVTEKEKPDKNDMLAYTKFGGYEYWTSVSQTKKLSDVFTYIIDEKPVLELEKKYSSLFDIVKIKIVGDNFDGVSNDRKQRDFERIVLTDSYYDLVITNRKGELDNSVREIVNFLKEKNENYKF